MEIITSWMIEGEQKLILRQLRKRLGDLDPVLVTRIEALTKDGLDQLGDALLDFTCAADLEAWLASHQ